MRMLMIVTMPHDTFKAAVKDGTAASKTMAILDAMKPEAVYHAEMKGHRCMVLIVDVAGAAMIPALAEPWFLTFDADVEFHPVMSLEDLAEAGLGELGKKWA